MPEVTVYIEMSPSRRGVLQHVRRGLRARRITGSILHEPAALAPRAIRRSV